MATVSIPIPGLVLEDETLQSVQNTIAYWRQAHVDQTPYHERFPGYCWFCSNLPVDYLRLILQENNHA